MESCITSILRPTSILRQLLIIESYNSTQLYRAPSYMECGIAITFVYKDFDVTIRSDQSHCVLTNLSLLVDFRISNSKIFKIVDTRYNLMNQLN